MPRYALEVITTRQINKIINSRAKDEDIPRNVATISAINGNDRPNPTPAPARIPKIKNISSRVVNKKFIGVFLLTKSEPKVNDEEGFLVMAIAKATAGSAYIAQPLKPQWKDVYALIVLMASLEPTSRLNGGLE
jgi:hypothetical protein